MSEVVLQLYDISNGLARMMSMAIIGKQIDGIWHTSIVAYGKEYYFGGGICCDVPLTTPFGMPVNKIPMGSTQKTKEEFERFLRSVSGHFTAESYHVVTHNCNDFSNECTRFLLDKRIPDYITGLPAELLSTPIGQQFAPMVNSMMSMKDQMFAGVSQNIDHWQDFASHDDYFADYESIDCYKKYDDVVKGTAVIVFWDPRSDDSMMLRGNVEGLKCKVAFCDSMRYFYLAPESLPVIRVVCSGDVLDDYQPSDFSVDLVNQMVGLGN